MQAGRQAIAVTQRGRRRDGVSAFGWNVGQTGAGEGNRTLVVSLGSFCSTIELHPRSLDLSAGNGPFRQDAGGWALPAGLKCGQVRTMRQGDSTVVIGASA